MRKIAEEGVRRSSAARQRCFSDRRRHGITGRLLSAVWDRWNICSAP
jgi:hypothetical protein